MNKGYMYSFPNIAPSSPPMGEMRRKARRDRKKATANMMAGPPGPVEQPKMLPHMEAIRREMIMRQLGFGNR
jgi:hypothetical protein